MLGAGSVTSVELDSDAIEDLQDNISEFEIDNIDIIQGDVTSDLLRYLLQFEIVVSVFQSFFYLFCNFFFYILPLTYSTTQYKSISNLVFHSIFLKMCPTFNQ